MKAVATIGIRHFPFSLKRRIVWVSLSLLIAMQPGPHAAGGEMRGSGTEADPFLIEDYADLLKVGVDSTAYALHSVYRLTKNIDGAASKTENRGAGFEPIGRYAKVFSGVFHGAGYTISNLTLQEGFFGTVRGGQIDSLGLRNISAKGTNIHAGGLASTNRGGSITGCYTTGSVSSNGRTGGLIGQNIGGTLTYCYSTCTVSGNRCSGGLVGWNDSGSIVRHSFATGILHDNLMVGGLVGMNSMSLVEGCYSTGILAHDCTWAGGLIGYNAAGKLIGCYTSGGIFKSSGGAEVCGGLCGINSPQGTITGCYWNTENSGKVAGVGIDSGTSAIIGLSTLRMKQSSSFNDWDFADRWISPSDSTYPGLRCLPNGPFAMVDTFLSGGAFKISNLLLNDCAMESGRANLVLDIDTVNWGTIDNENYLFLPTAFRGDEARIRYRVGEKRPDDTLWGGSVLSVVILDTTVRTTSIQGKGTREQPFLIACYDDLKMIGASGTRFTLGSVYRLIADIDASASRTDHGDSGFVPIGTFNSGFTGRFEGAGHVIRNLCINRPGVDLVGLFGSIDGNGRSSGTDSVRVDSLLLLDCVITGGDMVGGIAGRNTGVILACQVTGRVAGGNRVGGFVGYMVSDNSNTRIFDCFTNCFVSSDTGDMVGGLVGHFQHSYARRCFSTSSTRGKNDVGGFIGRCEYLCNINECFATGSVQGIKDVGGLIGRNSEPTSVIDCYSTGPVTGIESTGGFIGSTSGSTDPNSLNRVYRSYSAGLLVNGPGAFIGSKGYQDTVISCYWNVHNSAEADNDYPLGFNPRLTTTQMKYSYNFSGFDFKTIWKIRSDSTFPGLQTVDNAPFAFDDTTTTVAGTQNLRTLLLNDCDVETGHKNLVLHVINASCGVTDSVAYFSFTPGLEKGSIATVRYRVGEVRTKDTLWGNIAVATITLDVTMSAQPRRATSLPKTFDVYATSNHFMPSPVMTVALPIGAPVSLRIFDLHGRKIATLFDGDFLPAGYHVRRWNAAGIAPGVYFYRLQTGDKNIVGRMWK